MCKKEIQYMTNYKLADFSLPRWAELPSIALYLDQVLIILNEALRDITAEDEKVITATIINNYVKQKVIMPTVKKKYSREHLAELIMITALKRVLSTAEIVLVLRDIKSGRSTEEAYEIFCEELENGLRLTGAAEESGRCPELSRLAIKALTGKIMFDFTVAEQEKGNA